MEYKSKCWVDGHWIIFKLNTGAYQNILSFLDASSLLFLADLALDLPLSLHGSGNSRNLYEYLANNGEDTSLISKFLGYWLNQQLDMRYIDGTSIKFSFSPTESWQNFTVYS